MKIKTKILLILLAVGTLGLALTMGYIMGSGMLLSRQAAKTFVITEPYESVQFDTANVYTTIEQSETDETYVDVFAKAWLSHEIDMDSLFSVTVQDGVMTISQKPFPDQFLGIFPQPSELHLNVYLPQDVYEQWEGEAK